jgi:hypothetical protein
MAPRQNLPLVLDYGDGRPIRAVTRTLDRSGVSYYVDAEMPVPPLGAEIAFEARIGGGAARGRAVVLKVEHMDDGIGREMVVVCDVLELHGAAERAIQRAGFRERVVEFAAKHPDGEKILEAAGDGMHRRMRPNTRPIRPREAHWVPEPYVPKPAAEPEAPSAGPHSEREPLGGSSAPKSPKSGRKRPRPSRHHWEVENRFKPTGS